MQFPSEEYWSWKPIVKEKEKIEPGGVINIYKETINGWLYYARLLSTSPDVKINVDWKADGVIEIAETIRHLKDAGYSASQLGFRILTYDDFESIYSLEFAPGIGGFPGVPFRGASSLYLVNTGSVDAYIWFTGWIIEVKK
jgi:hypothetical protein